MTRMSSTRSIVGIDPSSRGLAFAFFEEGALLDWGTRRRDGQELGVLDDLLKRCQADVLVLEDGDAPGSERRPRMRRLLGALADHAGKQGVVVVPVSRSKVRDEWLMRGKSTKHEVAAGIAELFPDLEPLVPPPRKFYNSEKARTNIFDAASLVLTAFPRYGSEASEPGGL